MNDGTNGLQRGFTQGGFEERFRVTRVDGKPINAKARYLILDYSGRDPHARVAISEYARSIETENPQMAADLRDALDHPERWPAQHENAADPRYRSGDCSSAGLRSTVRSGGMSEEMLELAISSAAEAMGWTDPRMVFDARRIAEGYKFSTFGHGGECFLTGDQVTRFQCCLAGAKAALRARAQVREAES